MAFFVHGLSGHEAMPMNRLFKKRPVNQTEQIYPYQRSDKRRPIISAGENKKQQRNKAAASEFYMQIAHVDSDQQIVSAAEIMISPVEVLSVSSKISDALALFEAKKFRHVPVVSETCGLVGIISDRDVLKHLANLADKSGDTPPELSNEIVEIMTTDVVSASSDTDVRYIAGLFVEDAIGAMPIIDKGELVGILTRSDILRAVMKNFHIGLWA